MKAFEFEAVIGRDLTIPVPPEVAGQLSSQFPVRVLVKLEEPARLASSPLIGSMAREAELVGQVCAGIMQDREKQILRTSNG